MKGIFQHYCELSHLSLNYCLTSIVLLPSRETTAVALAGFAVVVTLALLAFVQVLVQALEQDFLGAALVAFTAVAVAALEQVLPAVADLEQVFPAVFEQQALVAVVLAVVALALVHVLVVAVLAAAALAA